MRQSWSLDNLDKMLGDEKVTVWKEAYARPLQSDYTPYQVTFRDYIQQVPLFS
jgi:hypothetical protein